MNPEELAELLANETENHELRFTFTQAKCSCGAWSIPVLDINKIADLECYLHQQHLARVQAELSIAYFQKELTK